MFQVQESPDVVCRTDICRLTLESIPTTTWTALQSAAQTRTWQSLILVGTPYWLTELILSVLCFGSNRVYSDVWKKNPSIQIPTPHHAIQQECVRYMPHLITCQNMSELANGPYPRTKRWNRRMVWVNSTKWMDGFLYVLFPWTTWINLREQTCYLIMIYVGD